MDDRQRPARPVLTPLLPARTRRPAAILVACCAVFVAVLGAVSARKSAGNAVDRPIDSWIVRNLGPHWHVLLTITDLGNGLEVAALTIILALACLAARRVNGAVLAVAGVSVAAMLTEFAFKPLVHQTIHGGLSYPSGHTTALFALTAVAGVVMLPGPPGKRPRPVVALLIVLGLVLVGCVVAAALIGLQFHYFTDTVAGAAVGVGVVLAAAFPLDRPAVRRRLAAIF